MKCTATEKLRYIDAVLLYIEKHLPEELNPENIAEQHYISLSQLYRDFYACTGHSIKEYVRKRRISNACEKIKCSDMPLAVIANGSGYETQQAFYKQFKSTVGMTPFEYRQADTYFYFYPFTVNDISIAVKVGAETIPECTTTRFYDSCPIGIEDKAIASLGAITGRVFGRNGKKIGGQLCYEIMTEREGEGKTDLFATCVVNYIEQEINDGWNYLYNTWLSASMFEENPRGGESGSAYFEEFIFQNGNYPHGREPRKLKLYLPVKKRKMEQHITITTVPEMSFVIAREQGHNAERKASEKVMAFLQEHHPLLVRNAQKFYVCEYRTVLQDDVYECGIECDVGFKLPNDSGLEIISIPAGQYAVLPDDRLGDMSVGCAKMELWLRNDGVAHDNEPVFAVYETSNGKYDAENTCMKIYKRLNVTVHASP
jgi:AraC-like DNA-binding protein/DNA gyrase inhibitor GyrI